MTETAVTNADTARDTYLALRRRAKNNSENFAETLMLYKLERTLHRLMRTRFRDKFVLKGGFLLAAYTDRRPTKDLDAALSELTLDETTVREVCRAIAGLDEPDGLTYDIETLTIDQIREGDDDIGFRAAMTCTLHTDLQKVTFDFSTGDPVAPPATLVTLPGLLGQDVVAPGYPPAMIVAEKLVTALDRGASNTRWRDFVDLNLIGRTVRLDPDEAATAIGTVAAHREVPLEALGAAIDLTAFADQAQPRYVTWLRKKRLSHAAPEELAVLLAAVSEFVDPLIQRARSVNG